MGLLEDADHHFFSSLAITKLRCKLGQNFSPKRSHSAMRHQNAPVSSAFLHEWPKRHCTCGMSKSPGTWVVLLCCQFYLPLTCFWFEKHMHALAVFYFTSWILFSYSSPTSFSRSILFLLKRQISKGRRHHGSFLLPTRYSLFLNPPLLSKILHKHCLQFLLGRLSYLREIKNKGYSKLRWMANKVYYGRCVNGKWSHNPNNRLTTNRVLRFRGFLLRSTRGTILRLRGPQNVGTSQEIHLRVIVLLDSWL